MRVSDQTEFALAVKAAVRKLGKRAGVRVADYNDEALGRVARALGRADIKGIKDDPCQCPLARFLNREIAGDAGAMVYADGIGRGAPDENGEVHMMLSEVEIGDLPEWVGWFIMAFDNGEFPELEAS